MILTTLSLGLAASTGAPDLETVLARTRAALGLDGGAGAIELAGDADVFGAPTSFTFTFAADGRFLNVVDGPLGNATGFDGLATWSSDAGWLATTLELEDDEFLRLWSLFLSGRLFLSGSNEAEVSLAGGEPKPGEVALDARIPGGLRVARVAIDAATGLPMSLAFASILGGETWTLADWRPAGARRVPYRIERHAALDTKDVYRVTRTGTPIAERAFAPDPTRGLGAFDRAVASDVEVRLAPTGHLLVHPRVSGRDVGWFILDTGAGIPVITKEAADAAGLEAMGRTFVGGAGSDVVPVRFRIGGRFALGPLATPPLVFVEMDLAAVGAALGTPLAGVIGFELFRRAVVLVDMTAPTVAIHDPAAYALPAGASWTRLVVHQRHPHVPGRYEGGPQALFRLDTGAGSTAVVFHGPAVERRRLLEGRDVKDVSLGGAGGLSRAKMGEVKDFEIAGTRRDSVPAIFTFGDSGSLDDPYSDGTIGAGLVGDRRLVFDYGQRRIAFLPR